MVREPGEIYSPLSIYIDVTERHYPQWTRGQPIKQFQRLKNQVNAFLDWVLPRFTEIDTISLGTISLGPTGDVELNQPLRKNWSIENEFLDILTWALEFDPVYSSVVTKEWLESIKIVSEQAYTTINNSKLALFRLTPPDVIITPLDKRECRDFNSNLYEFNKLDFSDTLYFHTQGQDIFVEYFFS